MTEFLNASDLWLPGSIAMGCLILCSGFFSASETAFFYLSHAQLRTFQTGNSRQRTVARLMSNPDRLLTAVLFWNLIINLLFFCTSVIVAQRLSREGYNYSAGLYGFLGLGAIILFGEVCPKSVAVVFKSLVAPTVAYPLAMAVRILDPILPPMEHIARAMRRAFWPKLEREAVLRPEDLEQVVDQTQQSAHLVQVERQILHNVLDLSEITVEEVMRPRGMYPVLRLPLETAAVHDACANSDYVVVLTDTGEEIAGAVVAADITSAPDIAATIRQVDFVPWSGTLALALQTMQERYSSVVAVVNEYGETAGIVTETDVLDTILSGPSRTKRLLERDPVRQVGDDKYEVEGITTLRYLNSRLGLEHDQEIDAALTISGLLYERLEAIPQPDQACLWKGWEVRVIEAGQRGKLRACLTRITGTDREQTR